MWKENISVFFSGLDARKVTFQLSSGPRVITAYFDNEFFDAATGEAVLRTTEPRLTAIFDDVKDIPRGTKLNIEEIPSDFWTLEIEKDETKTTTVLLSKIQPLDETQP